MTMGHDGFDRLVVFVRCCVILGVCMIIVDVEECCAASM